MYHGIQNGMPVYDYLEEVPRAKVESGEKFIVLFPPEEMVNGGSETYSYNSPPIIAIIGYAILIAIVGIVTVAVLQQLGYILQGRPGQKIDDNLFEGGDGSVWVRDKDGNWVMQKGPTSSMIVWAVVAIALIVVVVLVYLQFNKTKGGKKK